MSEVSGSLECVEGPFADLAQLIQEGVHLPSGLLIADALACVRAQQPWMVLVNEPLPQELGCDMPAKKQKGFSSARREIARLEQKLRAVDAQIARLERDPDVGLATRDHFIVWKRPCLFAVWPSVIH
jgi:hypothetical protein